MSSIHTLNSLCTDLWTHIVNELLKSCSPLAAANNRAALASVSRSWKDHTYNTPLFWSYISICKSLGLDNLEFALSRSKDAPLDIQITIRDVDVLHRPGTNIDNIIQFVNTVFDLIGHTSARWRSFELVTENPAVFLQVNEHCRRLPAKSMRSLRLSYVYMPGYSTYPAGDLIYRKPFAPSVWFQDQLPSLIRLDSFCAPINWSTAAFFANLDTVYIAYGDVTEPVDAYIIPHLFTVAVNMRCLRLGPIAPCLQPLNTRLVSCSLRALDIELGSGPFAAVVFSLMDVPGLTHLTIRNIGHDGALLLNGSTSLMTVTSLTVYSQIDDGTFLSQLFTHLPLLSELNLTHSSALTFSLYCKWAFTCLPSGEPNHIVKLKRLLLCHVNLDTLALLVTYIKQSVISSGVVCGIVYLRVEKPDSPYFDRSLADLRSIIPDFALTNIYSAKARAIARLWGSSYHSYITRDGYH